MPYQLNGNQTDKYPSPLNRSNCDNCCPTKDFTYFTTPSNALYYTTYEGYIYVVEPESLTPERLKDSNGKDFILTDYYPYVPAAFGYNTGDVTNRNGGGPTDIKNIGRLPKPYHSYLETDDSGDAVKRTEFVGFQDSVNTCIVWRTEYKYNVINGAVTLSNILRRVCYQGQYDGAGTPITWSNSAGPCGQFPEIIDTTYNPVTTFKTDGNGNPVYHTEYQKNEDGTFKRDANGNKIIDTAKSGGNPELEDNPEKQQWIFTTTVRNVDDCTQENATQATRFSPHWVYGTSGIQSMSNTPSWKWEQCVDCQRMAGLEEDLPELQTCVNDEIMPDRAAHLSFNGFASEDGKKDIEFPTEIPEHYEIPPDKWEFDKTIEFPPLEEGGEPSVLTLHCKTHWVKKKNPESTCAMTGYDKQFGWRCEAQDAMIWFPVLQNFRSKMWAHVGNKPTVDDLPQPCVTGSFVTQKIVNGQVKNYKWVEGGDAHWEEIDLEELRSIPSGNVRNFYIANADITKVPESQSDLFTGHAVQASVDDRVIRYNYEGGWTPAGNSFVTGWIIDCKSVCVNLGILGGIIWRQAEFSFVFLIDFP
ncbi:hypothetical protein FACS189443_3200 [Planctomycetales bacterium]|nr:hypothetical protein FACS189443_3200 [Planctomycetales bacterium]